MMSKIEQNLDGRRGEGLDSKNKLIMFVGAAPFLGAPMPFRPPSVLLLSLLVLGLPALAEKPTATANQHAAASQKGPVFQLDVVLAEDVATLKNPTLKFSAHIGNGKKRVSLAVTGKLSGKFLAGTENKDGRGALIRFQGKDTVLFTADQIKAALPVLGASPDAAASLEFVITAGEKDVILDLQSIDAKDLARYLGFATNGGLKVTLHREGNTTDILKDQTTFESMTH